MKFPRKSLISVIIFLFSLSFLLSAEIVPKGKKLCDENYDFFKKAGIKPQTQSLMAADSNTLPYNIIIRNQKDEDAHKLIFLFEGDEIWGKQEIIVSLANYLKENVDNWDILVSYGDKYDSSFIDDEVLTGFKVYMNSLNSNQDSTIIISKLTEKKNSVITGSEGHSSPSWLTKAVIKGFTDSHVTKNIHLFYISQLSKTSFNIEPSLHMYLENGFSAISTTISTKTNDIEKTIEILQNIAQNFVKQKNKLADHHFAVFRVFRSVILLSEYSIVRILIVILFVNLLFIFIYGFVKQNLQSELWKSIVRSYIIPVTIVINLFSFFLGESVYEIIIENDGFLTTYGILVFQVGTALLLNSIYFLIEIFFHHKYDDKSIDTVIFISTLLNQFLFAIIDISTFPFFFLFCVLSLLSLVLKQNRWHIILMILMILAYVPYLTRIFLVSDFNSLTSYLYTNPIVFISISILILPMEIMWFRILTSFNQNYKTSKRRLILTTAVTYGIFLGILIAANTIFFKNNNPEPLTVIESDDTNQTVVTISTEDTLIFEDIIRTLKVNFLQQPYYCEIIITSPNSNPVQYSTSDYTIIDENTAIFRLPHYPPEKLNFNYGASKYDSIVTVKAYYLKENGVHIQNTAINLTGVK